MINSVKETTQQSSNTGNIGQPQGMNLGQNQVQSGQSPQSQYQQSSQIHNEGNFKKNRVSGQPTSTQVSNPTNQQNITEAGIGYMPNSNQMIPQQMNQNVNILNSQNMSQNSGNKVSE